MSMESATAEITARRLLVSFELLGEPKPQGSKISHAIYDRHGKPVMQGGRVLIVTREDNPDVTAWRAIVASKAKCAYQQSEPHHGPVMVCIAFARPRPQVHYGTGRNAGIVKSWAPRLPAVRPDVSKLARAIEDALSGVVYHDDSQICESRHRKTWSDDGLHHTFVNVFAMFQPLEIKDPSNGQ